MSRIVHTGDTPAKRRHAQMRSCAEALRLLAQRPAIGSGTFDAEARDLTAFLVFNLRDLFDTVEQSAQSWDDRGYWKKSEELRERYRWSRTAAAELESLIVADDWKVVPTVLIGLVPRFGGVKVQQLTRDADWWCGALRALLREAEGRASLAP